MAEQSNPSAVHILGAGAIGCAFAAAFRDAGADVVLVEPDETARHRAPGVVEDNARAIETAGLAAARSGRLRLAEQVGDELARAALVIECGPERLEAKRRIFADLLSRAPSDAVLASASSAIPISQTVPDPGAQGRCLVAHPANPPSVLRVVELVPGPGTAPATRARAAILFEGAGFTPVLLGHEIEGFVMNRLQGAVLREAYRLVDEGVATATEIDTVMRLSLGPRWALSGPFETAELNTPGGILGHAERLGPAYRRMGEARGETVDWHPDLLAAVERDRRRILPAERIADRVAWRTRAVARLVAARDAIVSDDNG